MMTQKPSNLTQGVYITIEELIRLQHKAQGFSFLPHQPVHSLLTGRHASRLRGRGMDFEEIRRYLPGDDIRKIDWKVTSRTKKPHTRVYTEERERPVLLVVDQRMSMFFGTRVNMKSVTAAHGAALAAWRVVDQGDRVGALVFNDTQVKEVSPHRSRKRVMQILGEIVRLNQLLKVDNQDKANPTMLNQVLGRTSRIAKHDYLICIISDFYGMDKNTKRLIKLMGQHNDVLVTLIYDPLAAKPPQGGRFVVSDGELQIEVDTSSGKKRTDIANIFKERLRSLKDELTKLGIPVLPIQTEDPVEIQVRRLLGQAIAAQGGGHVR
jgi:uncharacterized protein (DUF58 family)